MVESVAGLWWAFILAGVGVGFLSSLLGIGGGIIVVPMLALLFQFPQKTAQGTSLVLVIPIALAGAAAYWKTGNLAVNPNAVALLIAGSIVGVVAGVRAMSCLPGTVLRKIFALLIMIVAVWMFVAPGKENRTPAGKEGPQNASLDSGGGQ